MNKYTFCTNTGTEKSIIQPIDKPRIKPVYIHTCKDIFYVTTGNRTHMHTRTDI